MITAEQKQEVFDALVTNGLDFIERSAGELEDEQKFAIAHFATGLELILKARLFYEHWTLVEVRPHKADWNKILEGTGHTIQASELCSTITSVTGTSLSRQKDTFNAVFSHRNRVLHAFPGADLQGTVAEQCRAWTYLNGLMSKQWSKVFESYHERIDGVEESLRVYRAHLQVRYEQLEPSLREPRAQGRLGCCSACEFESAVTPDATGHCQPTYCEVCGHREDHAFLFPCGYWTAVDGVGHLPCVCGETHQLSDFVDALEPTDVPPLVGSLGVEAVLDLFEPTPFLSPKEMSSYEAPRAHCGDCNSYHPTAVPFRGLYLCVECAVVFDDEHASYCERCNESWVGRDTEHSIIMGCDLCNW